MCEHSQMIGRAIEISGERMRAGFGGPFGALVVKDGAVIAEGYNQVTSGNDPTAHAEVVAIRQACTTLERFDLSGCVIYTSCEPCPMCLAAIYWARLDHVYYGNTREDAARIGFDDAALYDEIALPIEQRTIPMTRIQSAEAEAIFREWEDKEDKVSY